MQDRYRGRGDESLLLFAQRQVILRFAADAGQEFAHPVAQGVIRADADLCHGGVQATAVVADVDAGAAPVQQGMNNVIPRPHRRKPAGFAPVVINEGPRHTHGKLPELLVPHKHGVAVQRIPHQVLVAQHLVGHRGTGLSGHVFVLVSRPAALPGGRPVREEAGVGPDGFADSRGVLLGLRPQAPDNRPGRLTAAHVGSVHVRGQLLQKVFRRRQLGRDGLEGQIKEQARGVAEDRFGELNELVFTDKGERAEEHVDAPAPGVQARQLQGDQLNIFGGRAGIQPAAGGIPRRLSLPDLRGGGVLRIAEMVKEVIHVVVQAGVRRGHRQAGDKRRKHPFIHGEYGPPHPDCRYKPGGPAVFGRDVPRTTTPVSTAHPRAGRRPAARRPGRQRRRA